MRSLCLVLALAACGDGSHAKPDAAGDAAPDTGSGSGSGSAASEIDTTFGTNGTAAITGGTCRAFAVDASDRSLVVVGAANGQASLVRFDASGQPDASFTPRALGSADVTFAQLTVLSGGDLVVTGIFGSGSADDPHLYRLTADGTIDVDLRLPPLMHPVIALGERTDGGLDLAAPGDAFEKAFAFSRITAAGAVDTTFGTQGVAEPATPNLPPRYFAHAVSLGNGTFALSDDSFKTINQQGGDAPVVGHMLLATDGAITKTTTIDDTQFLYLAAAGGKVYALTAGWPSETGTISRFASDLTADATFTTAEASTFNPVYGLYNGGALAVAADGSLIATNDMTLDRFHADGTARSVVPAPFTYPCGIAFDSHGRALVASSTGILRLVQ